MVDNVLLLTNKKGGFIVRLPRFEYVSPSSVNECLSILDQSGKEAEILAGGTDLLVNMKFGVKQPRVIVNVKSIPELNAVSTDENGNMSIGAAVILSDLAGNPMVKETLPALHSAIKQVGSKHIRNMACIGGNVCLDTRCWYTNQSKLWRDARALCYKQGGDVCHAVKNSPRCHAINNSDTAPALIALKASVEVVKKGGKRLIPFDAFYQDDGQHPTVLAKGEIVTVITVPKTPDDTKTVFIKVCSRRGIDFANGSIAASVTGDGNQCSDARVVVGSLSSMPRLLEETSQHILQEGLTEQSIETAAGIARKALPTTTNLFTSPGYKRDLTEVLVKQALHDVRHQMEEKRRAKP